MEITADSLCVSKQQGQDIAAAAVEHRTLEEK